MKTLGLTKLQSVAFFTVVLLYVAQACSIVYGYVQWYSEHDGLEATMWVLLAWFAHASLNVIYGLIGTETSQSSQTTGLWQDLKQSLRQIAQVRQKISRKGYERVTHQFDVVYDFLASVMLSMYVQEKGTHRGALCEQTTASAVVFVVFASTASLVCLACFTRFVLIINGKW